MIFHQLLTLCSYSISLHCPFYPKCLQRLTEDNRYKARQKGKQTSKQVNKSN